MRPSNPTPARLAGPSLLEIADEIEARTELGRGDCLSLAGFVVVCAECLVRSNRYRVTSPLLVQFAGYDRSWGFRRLRRLRDLGLEAMPLDVALELEPRRARGTIAATDRPRRAAGTSGPTPKPRPSG